MTESERLKPSERRWFILWLIAGVLLRALLILYPRSKDDDTDAYLELGRNLLHHGTYGFMGDDNIVSPALFRLPGYPIFLASLGGNMTLIAIIQSVIDLFGCVLLFLFLKRYVSSKAALICLALSTTCFFTAIYATCALTESLSIFAVSAAIYCLGELLAKPEVPTTKRLIPVASCAALAMLLRPDGVILAISIAVALFIYGIRRTTKAAALRAAIGFGLLAYVPLIPWAIRNEVTFHTFQPLAPHTPNDPGEWVAVGFYRWLRTWSIDFETTGNVFWRVLSDPVDLRDLPPRAYDSPEQQAQTYEIFTRQNQIKGIDQPLDDRFAALAETRIQSHPLRYFVWVPALRVADMWLRPRTEGLDISPAWWRVRDHPWQSAAAIALALLNLFYILAAIAGAFRKPPLAILFATYVILRCLLLATVENPEPRYSLEAYPIVLVLAAIFLASERRIQSPSP